jgi:hypothetical protein
MRRARRLPDGTFEFDGELYRLEDDRPERFVVRRLRNAEVVGALRFVGGKHRANVEVEGVAASPPAAAIARLLDGALGIVPLQ